MKVTVQLHTGAEHTYEQANHVSEKDKYSIFIYGDDNRVLAILDKGDIKNLLTDENPE